MSSECWLSGWQLWHSLNFIVIFILTLILFVAGVVFLLTISIVCCVFGCIAAAGNPEVCKMVSLMLKTTWSVYWFGRAPEGFEQEIEQINGNQNAAQNN